MRGTRPRLLLACLTLLAACAPGTGAGPSVDAGIVPYVGVQSVVALAGADLRVLEGSRVQLDGHASRSLLEDGDLVLAWSQVEGPSVVLTNPSSPSPAFVAPLSPATLRFRLRAASADGVAFDEVTVRVLDSGGGTPFFVEVPGDAAVSEGGADRFVVEVVGHQGAVTLAAEARCEGEPNVSVAGNEVTVTGFGELPCLVVVDAVDAQGRRSAAAARVFWPRGVDVPTETRLAAPVVAEPGSAVAISFDALEGGASTRAWPAGGNADGLAALVEGPQLSATAPMRRARVVLAGERRIGAASGGVRYALIDVTAGAGNRAPTSSGGSDRRVRPGASFTLTTSGSADLDEDPLTIEVNQVIGPAATFDAVQPGLFHAPDAAAVLLFHVTAFDGRVYSDPDAVRVVVDPNVENQQPILVVEPIRWVSPGTVFRLDASAAYDPDSGFIDRWSIAQDPADEVVLLSSPVAEPVVELVAGADGDVYHFRLSAFDEDGQGAFADIEVIVEEAGPYVDAATGDDVQGNGTQGAPFASLAAALEVAERHQLPELRIAGGSQLPFGGRIDGIDVIGGWQRDGDDWTHDGAPTRLPIATGGVTAVNATLSRLTLDLTSADSSFTLEGRSALDSVNVTEGPVHAGPLLKVASAATATLLSVSLTASSPTANEAELLVVQPGAALRMNDTTLTGGLGGRRVGLSCTAATVDLIDSEVVATTGAVEGTGLRATGCDIQILGSRLTGGTATLRAIGLHATDTLLYVAPDTTLSGAALGSSSSASALIVDGGDAPVLISGSAIAVEAGAAAEAAIGVDVGATRVAIQGASVSARGTTEATGVLARADGVQIVSSSIDALCTAGSAVAVDLVQADDVTLERSELSASGANAFGVRAAAAEGVLALRLSALVIEVDGADTVAGVGLGASRGVLANALDVTVTGANGATAARGIGLRDGALSDSRLVVSGGGEVLGAVVATGGSGTTLSRTSLRVASTGGSAVGVLGGSPVVLAASFVRVESPLNALGVDARAATRLRHATVWADDTALLGSSSTGVLDAANSVLVGATAFERTPGAPPPTLTAYLALAAARPWVDGSGYVASTPAELAAAGCTACFSLTDPQIDDTGHLLAGAGHPLVDAASPEYAVDVDIDGDALPVGPLPDIGCDERVAGAP